MLRSSPVRCCTSWSSEVSTGRIGLSSALSARVYPQGITTAGRWPRGFPHISLRSQGVSDLDGVVDNMNAMPALDRAATSSSHFLWESGTILSTCAILVAIAWFAHHRQLRRDAALAARWEWMLSRTGTYGPWLARIVRTYQPARRGSKAYICWCGTNRIQDSWFWRWRGADGTYVLVSGRTGWGPHNSNPQTFYIHPGQLLATVSGDAPAAWQRHHQRVARRSHRHGLMHRSDPMAAQPDETPGSGAAPGPPNAPDAPATPRCRWSVPPSPT